MRCLFLICLLSTIGYALNGYPLPASFTENIRLSGSYGIIRLKALDLASVGGTALDMNETISFAIKWGQPFEGFQGVFQWLNQSVVSAHQGDVDQTKILINVLKLRRLFPLIKDQSSTCSAIFSAGTFFGNYTIQRLSEENGVSRYIERNVSGLLLDGGVLFGYELNSDWHLFLQALYQVSLKERAQTLLGQPTNGSLELTGTEVQFGTVIRW